MQEVMLQELASRLYRVQMELQDIKVLLNYLTIAVVVIGVFLMAVLVSIRNNLDMQTCLMKKD